MKRTSAFAGIMLVLTLALAACGEAPAPTPQASTGGNVLRTDYADATSLRNQLALGIIRLDGTPQAVTTTQAKQLLPLWQALAVLTASSTAASAEVEAMQNQIISILTLDQAATIADMRLTNADLQAYYAAIGVTEIRTPEAGATAQSGSMKSLPQEQREAARATAVASGTPIAGGQGGSKNTVLTDNLMALLASK